VEDTLDVAGLVHQLRQQRMGMVQVAVLLLLSLKHGALARLW
jgi:protein tyrosine phosphatase